MLQSSGTLAHARGCPPAFHHSQTTRLSSFLRTWCFSNNLFHTQLLPSLPPRQLLPGTSCLPLCPPPHGASTSPLSLSLKHSPVPLSPSPLLQRARLLSRPSPPPTGSRRLKGPAWGATPPLPALPDIQAGGLLSGILAEHPCPPPLLALGPWERVLLSLSPSHHSTACDSTAC